jgi:hypothetical protein
MTAVLTTQHGRQLCERKIVTQVRRQRSHEQYASVTALAADDDELSRVRKDVA